MNFIYKIKKAFPKENCKNLIKWIEDNENLSSPGDYGGKPLDNLEIGIDLKNREEYFGLGHYLNECIIKTVKKFDFLNEYVGEWKLDTHMRLVKYKPNRYYSRIHCENDSAIRTHNRMLAWTIFLNDIKKGGGTEFINQKYTAKPVCGDFYIWPAYWTHLHRGISAPKENKYIITGWCIY